MAPPHIEIRTTLSRTIRRPFILHHASPSIPKLPSFFAVISLTPTVPFKFSFRIALLPSLAQLPSHPKIDPYPISLFLTPCHQFSRQKNHTLQAFFTLLLPLHFNAIPFRVRFPMPCLNQSLTTRLCSKQSVPTNKRPTYC